MDKGVKTITLGGATIVFHDDYCKNKTAEEVQAILDRISAIALPAVLAAELKRSQAKEKEEVELQTHKA